MKPRFKHSSPCCRYLGTHNGHDLYSCDGMVIARYGSRHHHYISIKMKALKAWGMPELVEAMKRVHRRKSYA